MSDIDFSAAPQPALKPLPVFATAREALVLLGQLLPELERLALLAFLGVFLLSPIAILGGPAFGFFLLGVELFLVIWLATGVLRLVLLGPAGARLTRLPVWSSREVRVLGRFLGLGALVLAAALPAVLLFGSFAGAFDAEEPQLGAWLMGPAFVMLLMLVACVFAIPAAAIGRGYGFGQAWREAKDVLPQLVALALLVLLPLDLLLQLTAQLLLLFTQASGLVVPAFAFGIAADLLRTTVGCLVFAAAFARRRGWTYGAGPTT